MLYEVDIDRVDIDRADIDRVDIDRGSVYWVQQASWPKLYKLRKIGVVCVRFL